MSVAVPGWLLAYMKNRVADTLTDTCTIEKRSPTVGQYGEPLQDQWLTIASGVSCRLITTQIRIAGMAGQAGQQEILADEYRLIVPSTTTLEADYRVTISSMVFQVVSIRESLTDAPEIQAILKRIRP